MAGRANKETTAQWLALSESASSAIGKDLTVKSVPYRGAEAKDLALHMGVDLDRLRIWINETAAETHSVGSTTYVDLQDFAEKYRIRYAKKHGQPPSLEDVSVGDLIKEFLKMNQRIMALLDISLDRVPEAVAVIERCADRLVTLIQYCRETEVIGDAKLTDALEVDRREKQVQA